MPKEFKFRKGDGRKAQRREFGDFWVEERTIRKEVVHEECSEDDPQLEEIKEIARQVSDDLSAGKITPAEAKRRLSSAVQRLSAREGEVCLFCGARNENPGSTVCDSCGAELQVETKIEIHLEGFDDD